MASLGEIKTLNRFPLKSHKGQSVDSIYVSSAGLLGDRLGGFRKKQAADDERNSRKFLTARFDYDLLLHEARVLDEPGLLVPYPSGYQPRIEVLLPDGLSYNLHDPQLLEHMQEKYGKELRVEFKQEGVHDARPVSLISLQSLQDLESRLHSHGAQGSLDPRRFRMNLHVDWYSGKPYAEDDLIGKDLRIGEDLVLYVDKPNERCVMINVDPNSGDLLIPQMPAMKKSLKDRKNCFGVYCTVKQPGVISVGDKISVK